MPTISELTPAELVAVYNFHTDKPVTRFENRAIGARRLTTLLTKVGVGPDDAIAAVIPNEAKQAATLEDDVATSEAFLAAKNAPETHAVESRKARRLRLAAAPEPAPKQNAERTAAKAAATKRSKGAAAPAREAKSAVAGKARNIIVKACSRPKGAASADLFAATGWKYASWSHQLKLITKQTGLRHTIGKVDGVTRYFTHPPEA